jgi:hypothetical protein
VRSRNEKKTRERAADVKNGDLFKSGLSLIPVTAGVTGNSETSSYTEKAIENVNIMHSFSGNVRV